MSEPLRFPCDSKTIHELIGFQDRGSLNPEPGFQRKRVWSR